MRHFAISCFVLGLCAGSLAFTAPSAGLRLTKGSSSSLASSSVDQQTQRNTANSSNVKRWQADLDEMLSPTTPPGRRQIVLQDLLNANQEIQQSVEKALQERTVRDI
jgi:hypothetical protein